MITTPAVTLERLIQPRSIAILGASESQISPGGAVLTNLYKAGFQGDIHLVSRTRSNINGRRCVPSIKDLPLGVDTAILAIPGNSIAAAVEDCIERRIGGAVVFAAGFAEMGVDGYEEQTRVAIAARAGGLALNGPNCAGFINYVGHVPLSFNKFDPYRDQKGTGVAVIAQSGAMAANIDEGLHARGLFVSHAISTGNEAVLGIEDFLLFLLDQNTTQLVVIFAEQIRRPQCFLQLIATAHRLGKPIVLMHPGRSERARDSAQSHTGAMAGDHVVMRTVLRHHGVRVVETLDELFDVAVLLARWPNASGNGVMVMTNSGALRSVAFDLAESVGVALPPLSPKTAKQLSGMFPPYASLENPLDLLTLGLTQPDIYGQAGALLLEDPACDAFIFASTPGPVPVQVAKAKSMLPLIATSPKPVALVMLGDEAALADEFVSIMSEAATPVFRSIDRIIRAMAHVVVPAVSDPPAIPRQFTTLPAQLIVPKTHGPLLEFEGKRILTAFGIAVPEGTLATTVEQAEVIAGKIGYPIALKAQARALTHKSDFGGVVLGITDYAELRSGWRRIHADIAQLSPDTVLEGVLVERMSAHGVEMIIGARRDAGWGVVIVVGLGGVTAEALGDIRLLPPGLSRTAIVDEIGKLKGARLLQGFRGAPRYDVKALADAVVSIATLMDAMPHLTVVEVNPIAVYAEGKGICALDALLIMDATLPSSSV